MLADHGLKKIPYAAYWRRPRPMTPKTRSAWSCRWTMASETEKPGGHLRDRHPGRPPGLPRKKRRAANFLAEASALTPGDLVVHIDHGIGRYEGLKTLDVQGAPHDCLDLLYGGEPQAPICRSRTSTC